MAYDLWSKAESERLASIFREGADMDEIRAAFPGRSRSSVGSKMSMMGFRLGDRAERERVPVHKAVEQRDPSLAEALERVAALERENARLSAQLAWAQHGESEHRTGGLLTIRRSDEHKADKQHLVQSCRQCEEKTLVLIEQYQPDAVQILWGDDLIAGRGIYREQDLDSATSSPEEQIQVGAWIMREYLESIRRLTDAPITSRVFNGNHNYAGSTPLTPGMFFLAKELACGVVAVDWILQGDRAIVNLAHDGTYNVLVTHGFGHSKISPNSTAFIDAMKDVIIQTARKLQPHEQVRRVISGHAHWMSVGLERVNELYFDTTGGFQRNSRVKLGMNQRPSGMIVYVSLPGMEGEILKPIEVKPNPDTYESEIESPTLTSANMEEVARCISLSKKALQDSGLMAPDGELGVLNTGRW